MKETTINRDVYSIVTEKIIALLEQNIVPWRKPWTTAGHPRNLLNNTPYRGINILLLASAGYDQNYFLTWQQVQQLKASVKKGETGHMIVFWKLIEEGVEGSTELKVKRFLRYHKVFNIAQCDNIPPAILARLPHPEKINDPIGECDKVVEGYKECPRIEHKRTDAFYDPKSDYINMPPMKKFTNSEAYYNVLFHELVHSTGHENRLKRPGVTEPVIFGSEVYSFEELVAEIGASFLNSITGIMQDKHLINNAAYIKGWLEQLRNDKTLVVKASAQAQRATDYILGIKSKEDKT